MNVVSAFSIPVKQDTLKPMPLRVDKQTEQEIFSDKDYVYTQEAGKSSGFFQDLIDWLIKKIFGNLSPESVSVFWNGVMLILAALFIAGLIFLILKMKGGRLFKGESARTSVFADMVEDIQSINIDGLIQKAIDQKDFRVAFRYSFLKSLQLMNNKKFIDWKPYKTNYEYYTEFDVEKIKPLFKDLYTGFEYVWYGDALINKEIFDRYHSEFDDFNRQLSV